MTAKHLKLVMCIILGLFSFLFGLDKEFRGIVIQGDDWAADSPEEMKS